MTQTVSQEPCLLIVGGNKGILKIISFDHESSSIKVVSSFSLPGIVPSWIQLARPSISHPHSPSHPPHSQPIQTEQSQTIQITNRETPINIFVANESQNGSIIQYSLHLNDYNPPSIHKLAEYSTKGPHPAHFSLSTSGGFLLSANYSGGPITIHRISADLNPSSECDFNPMCTINLTEIPLGPHPTRQDAPHPHQIIMNPYSSSNTVYVPDLGTDRYVTASFLLIL
jgi:6-phosphogluconolactonase (cycloisomerase 2 family)